MTDKKNCLLILKYEDVAKECEDCKKSRVRNNALRKSE